ncbi:MAG: hypothetical protein K6E62_06745 [Lachnospiraceae bacterium]|nr:hypothetical protein [Lachnospiraceae bacterium]
MFIKRLKQLEVDIDSENFDFIAISSQLEEFGRNNMMPQKLIRNAQLVFEEIVSENLVQYSENVGTLYPIRVIAEYFDTDESLTMIINYCGEQYDPFLDGDELSMKLVKKLASESEYCYEDGNNRIKVCFR